MSTNQFFTGQIGNITALPMRPSKLVRAGEMMKMQDPPTLLLNPNDHWHLLGKDMWATRLRGHPSEQWVRYGLPRSGTLFDALLPGWRR